MNRVKDKVAIITNLQGRGFRLVTVSKLLARDPKRN